MMLTTTLRAIRSHDPCGDGWAKLRKGLKAKYGKVPELDDEISFADILEINGLDDALWATKCAPQYDREWRLFAVRCARRVEHLMTDARSRVALDVAERHAHGDATQEELAAARAAAEAAAWDAARAAAEAAAWDAARAVQTEDFRRLVCGDAWEPLEAKGAAAVASERE